MSLVNQEIMLQNGWFLLGNDPVKSRAKKLYEILSTKEELARRYRSLDIYDML